MFVNRSFHIMSQYTYLQPVLLKVASIIPCCFFSMQIDYNASQKKPWTKHKFVLRFYHKISVIFLICLKIIMMGSISSHLSHVIVILPHGWVLRKGVFCFEYNYNICVDWYINTLFFGFSGNYDFFFRCKLIYM